jgi:hypothetical protein
MRKGVTVIRGITADTSGTWEDQMRTTTTATTTANAGPSTALLAKYASNFAQDDRVLGRGKNGMTRCGMWEESMMTDSFSGFYLPV